MRIYLNVPYSDKELAKRRGCRWDDMAKSWYIDDPLHIELFMKWEPKYNNKPITLINKARTASNVSKSRREYGKV